MKKFAIAKKRLSLVLALAALAIAGTPPAFAATRHAPSSPPLYMYAPAGIAQNPSKGSGAAGATRDAAIHTCSVKAGKYSFSAWETTQLAVYRSCMAEHGQVS